MLERYQEAQRAQRAATLMQRHEREARAQEDVRERLEAAAAVVQRSAAGTKAMREAARIRAAVQQRGGQADDVEEEPALHRRPG